MKLTRTIIHAYLYIRQFFHKLTATGAYGKKQARYINDPISADGNGLKKALVRYHVKQFHESSCSVASVVSVINALRAQERQTIKPITQWEILDKVRAGHWKERMGDNGHNGRRGLPLPLLGRIVESSLNAYEIAYKKVTTIPAPQNAGRSEKVKELLRDRLLAFETRGTGLLIAHFNQGAYVQALDIPHISPVGGYNPQDDQVTILDVDPDQVPPYEIEFDTFYKGLACNYNHVFRPFGYKGGGYVYIEL